MIVAFVLCAISYLVVTAEDNYDDPAQLLQRILRNGLRYDDSATGSNNINKRFTVRTNPDDDDSTVKGQDRPLTYERFLRNMQLLKPEFKRSGGKLAYMTLFCHFLRRKNIDNHFFTL